LFEESFGVHGHVAPSSNIEIARGAVTIVIYQKTLRSRKVHSRHLNCNATARIRIANPELDAANMISCIPNHDIAPTWNSF
jgi:hypothetical protein